MASKKPIIFFIFAVLLFIVSLAIVSSAPAYYNDYSDVLLVCNEDSSESQEICSYFIKNRSGSLGFNESHVVNLTGVSTKETVDNPEYEKVYNQTLDRLNNISSNINYVVTTKGVPIRTGKGVDCDFNNNSGGYPEKCKSIDARLMYDLGARSSYYNKDEVFTNASNGGYLATRLTGVNVSDVKNLIDNSRQARNGLNGYALINCYSSSFSNDFDSGRCSATNATIHDLGYEAEYNNTQFIHDRKNLSGYASWGSNANCGSDCDNSSKWNLSFNPGAIGETFVSTSAKTFNEYPWNDTGLYGGQSLISDLVRYNITGVKGYVHEPYAKRITDIDILWGRYLSGYNLADSYYMASEYRNYTGVVVGDPKTYVVRLNKSEKPNIKLKEPLNGSRVNNGTIISLNVNKTLNRPYAAIDVGWFNNGTGSNKSLNSPSQYLSNGRNFSINTTGWDHGTYNITFYSNDTVGNTTFKRYVFELNETIGKNPLYSEFNGTSTTNIKKLKDKTNVSNLTLENSKGKINFFRNVNVSGRDLNSHVEFSNRSIDLNSSALPELNKSANLTIYNNPASNLSDLTILKDGKECLDCYNYTSLDSENVTFNVSSFSSYSVSGLDKGSNKAPSNDSESTSDESQESDSSSDGPSTTWRSSHGWSSVNPGQSIEMSSISNQIGVEEVEIEFKDKAENVQIAVKKHSSRPKEVSKDTGRKTYQYIQIDAKNVEGKLDKASVTFRVEKSWVEQSSLTKDDLTAYKFDEENEEWNELDTEYSKEDDELYYYKTSLKGFSFFAISEKSESLTEDPNENKTSPEESPSNEDSKNQKETTNEVSVPVWAWIFLGVVVVGLVVWLAWSRRN